MKLIQKIIFTASILLTLVSCGAEKKLFAQEKQEVTIAPAVSETYTYEFNHNKCKTGEQSFSTLEAACDGLKDIELNNGCAEDLREELFVGSQCPGDFDQA